MAIDKVVFHKFVSGDIQAFEKTFKTFYKNLVLFSMRHGIEQMEAEDIVIETFHHLWYNRKRINTPDALNNLLYTSVHNRSKNVYRNLTNRSRIIKEKYEYEQDEDRDLYMEEEICFQLDNAIDILPTQCQKVMRLILKGKKMKEIAEILEISLSTAKTYKTRAINILKKEYSGSPDILIVLALFTESLIGCKETIDF